MTARPKPRQTVSGWANHVGSMLLECLNSDADMSVVIVLLQWLNQLQDYYETTQANTHRSLGTRPRHDYAHRVILNDCVSAPWSLMNQCLALTSLRDSHLLPTRHIRELGTDRQLFFSLPFPCFRFCTSVSISAFSTCPLMYGSLTLLRGAHKLLLQFAQFLLYPSYFEQVSKKKYVFQLIIE